MAVENFLLRKNSDGKVTGISTASGKKVDFNKHPEAFIALGLGVDDIVENSELYEIFAAVLQGKSRSKDG